MTGCVDRFPFYDYSPFYPKGAAKMLMRIEVGTGLENILKDEIAARIIRDDMAPKFIDQKFAAGLYAAIQKIAKLIEDNQHRIGK